MVQAKAEKLFREVGEDDEGPGIWFGMVFEDGVVTGGVGAEDKPGAGFGFYAHGQFADADAAVGADLDSRALAPDERPPRAGRDGPQRGAVFFTSFVPGALGCHAQFAMFFMKVTMGQ